MTLPIKECQHCREVKPIKAKNLCQHCYDYYGSQYPSKHRLLSPADVNALKDAIDSPAFGEVCQLRNLTTKQARMAAARHGFGRNARCRNKGWPKAHSVQQTTILDLLNQQPMTTAELCQRLKLSMSATYSRLSRMRKCGLVIITSRYWQLSEGTVKQRAE